MRNFDIEKEMYRTYDENDNGKSWKYATRVEAKRVV